MQNMYEQCVSVIVFKYRKNSGPAYISDLYSVMEKPPTTRNSRYKLKLPLQSTNMGPAQPR